LLLPCSKNETLACPFVTSKIGFSKASFCGITVALEGKGNE